MQALACSTQQCRCQLPPVEAAPSSPLPCIICEVDKILPFHRFLQMQHIIRNMDAVRPLQLISAPRATQGWHGIRRRGEVQAIRHTGKEDAIRRSECLLPKPQ